MSIDAIDFCVPFTGENSGLLSRVFFGLLRRHCDLKGITFHLVKRYVSEQVWSDVIRSAEYLRCPTFTYNLDTGRSPYKGAVDCFSYDSSCSDVEYVDPADTADYLVMNCGVAEWCILSHFDVIWRADIIDWLKKKQAETGAMMAGAHCPIMLLNRPAYYKCGVSFNPDATHDVAVLLGKALGLVVPAGFVAGDQMEWCFHHMGGGGAYRSLDAFQSMRDRALAIISKEGLS